MRQCITSRPPHHPENQADRRRSLAEQKAAPPQGTVVCPACGGELRIFMGPAGPMWRCLCVTGQCCC